MGEPGPALLAAGAPRGRAKGGRRAYGAVARPLSVAQIEIWIDRAEAHRDAIGRAGGFRISDAFISPLDLVQIGLASAAEAKDLHDMETAGAASS